MQGGGKMGIFDSLTQSNPEIKGIFNGFPDYGYGVRYKNELDKNPDRPKAQGFFGEIRKGKNNNVFSTEISIGTDFGEIPLIVPTLTRDELNTLMSLNLSKDKIPEEIIKKAINHASWRKLNGESPFAGINDKILPLPER
jgi:hypothetical protein